MEEEYIVNPKTGRRVKRSGLIGRQILLNINNQNERQSNVDHQLPTLPTTLSNTLKLRLSGVPLTRHHHLNGLVNYVRSRPITRYWTPYSGQLFNLLPKPTSETISVPFNIKGQPSWFLSSVRHGTHHDNPITTLIQINNEHGSMKHIVECNDENQKVITKEISNWAKKRLTNDDKSTTELKDKRTQELINERTNQGEGIYRTRLYRLHITKPQASFLRHMRGITRYLHNQCVNITSTNKDTLDYLLRLKNNELFHEQTLTSEEENQIQSTIDTVRGNHMALRKVLVNDSCWNEKNAWGLDAPWNLRDEAVSQFVTNLKTEKKKAATSGKVCL